jgi:mono/diheme cytochrome c family protein
MNTRYLLAIGLVVGAAVAACGGGSTGYLEGTGPQPADEETPNAPRGTTPGKTPAPGEPAPGVPGAPGQTSAPGAQKFYVDNVHPTLSSNCAGCHGGAGPGPNLLTAADAIKSHAQMLAAGYAVPQSPMVKKTAHGGSTTNFLKPAEVSKYEEWVALEAKERADKGQPPPANVLEKIGTCFDQAKFDALKMGEWRTTRRTANNNTNQVTPWNENGDNCTGCNQAYCRACHSNDLGSSYMNSVGNTLWPATHTFEESKTSPFVRQYFGVAPDGKPTASDGLMRKSQATAKDVAYSHPYFTLNATQMAAVKAFTDDAVAKYVAGTCGK